MVICVENPSANAAELERVWQLLEAVPDPEIPVVSVVELGIVRDVSFERDEVIVTITPTYSGCPATSIIAISIEEHLRQSGFQNVSTKRVLSPAWTTDWITQSARRKLHEYGIAPPADGLSCAGALHAKGVVKCPRCDSENTQEVSRFGSTPCKASWRCKDCLEPFDYFKSF